MDLQRMRDSSDTAPAPKPPAPKKQTPPPPAKPSGNTRRDRDYKRDREGQFSSVDSRGGGSGGGGSSGGSKGGRGKAGGAKNTDRGTRGNTRTPPPLEFGARNDPDRVRFLQRLLKSLKIADLKEDGVYGESTERAVMALQRRLGMTESGRVSNGLLKRIRDAEILSPCARGAKRSKEMDMLDELIRSVAALDPDDDLEEDEDEEYDEDEEPKATRAGELLRYDRSWALDDIAVRSGGDGRTVEAYAAVFDTPSEIKDQHGHYMEVITRTAFNRAISHGIERVNVFYHHGMTLAGTPSDLGSVPIGSPVDIRPDGRGLRTVTRFNRSQLADSVLEAIRDGNIRGYSFRGRIFQSNPARVPRLRGSTLPTITRTELGLAEYGPTPTPAYADAGIVAVRSLDQVASTLVALDADERAELIRMLTVATPHDPATGTATPDVGPGTEDSPDGRSGRLQQFREELRKRGVL